MFEERFLIADVDPRTQLGYAWNAIQEGGFFGVGVSALLARAGLPVSTFPAFQAALEATHEIGFVGTVGGAARLRRRMVERVLTRCETDETVAEPLLILLRRFATESAREEARVFCDELVADDVEIAPEDRRIAA